MECQIDAMLRAYPHLDRTICETLLKAHEAGTLNKYVEQMRSEPPPLRRDSVVATGGITIENVCEE